MPELPDIAIYIAALERRIEGRKLVDAVVQSPMLLRTAEPRLASVLNRRVTAIRRIGKRIAIGVEPDYWLVLHLMVAGRLHWHDRPPAHGGRRVSAIFEFETGALVLTEAGTKKRASLYVLSGIHALNAQDPGGLEILEASVEVFSAALRRENHTLKRALTDPHILAGIGNAYSDEILHRARLSPIKLTANLSADDCAALYTATRAVLGEWTEKLRAEAGDTFPAKVTAFRPGMAVHGRYGQPCPHCGTAVQRIRYASNETNYCPRCQTGGRLLADRSLSRLLKKDWPRSIDELEARRR